MSLGNEIQRLRKLVGISQIQLAERIAVNQSFISKLERGENDRLGADVLFRLCDALGVECGHFRAYIPNSSQVIPTPDQEQPAVVLPSKSSPRSTRSKKTK